MNQQTQVAPRSFRHQRIMLGVTVWCVSAVASAASFTSLGHLTEIPVRSEARDVSADGAVVVGWGDTLEEGEQAFRWTVGGGMVGLGQLPGGSCSRSEAVSSDGSVVVGTGSYPYPISTAEAFRWTADGGMVGLGDLPGGVVYSQADDVSADGNVVVGASVSESGDEAYRWTADGGMVGLGDLGGIGGFDSFANAVSADGSVVVGIGNSPNGHEAFRWTADGGMVGLGKLPGGSGFFSEAYGVSGDGSVVVGASRSANGSFEAFRWTADGGMVGLGDLPGGGFHSFAHDVSADGNVVVGYGDIAFNSQAFVWTQSGGMQRLFDVLVANGATGLTGWTLREAIGISSDGQWVVGFGDPPGDGPTEAFLANISPVPIPAASWLIGSAFGLLTPWVRRRGTANPIVR